MQAEICYIKCRIVCSLSQSLVLIVSVNLGQFLLSGIIPCHSSTMTCSHLACTGSQLTTAFGSERWVVSRTYVKSSSVWWCFRHKHAPKMVIMLCENQRTAKLTSRRERGRELLLLGYINCCTSLSLPS